MKGGFNKMFRNFAAMKGKTEFDKACSLLHIFIKYWSYLRFQDANSFYRE